MPARPCRGDDAGVAVGVERLSHLGLCVSDLARSLRFHCEGLGFREASRLEVAGAPSDTLLEPSGVHLDVPDPDGTRTELVEGCDLTGEAPGGGG